MTRTFVILIILKIDYYEFALFVFAKEEKYWPFVLEILVRLNAVMIVK